MGLLNYIVVLFFIFWGASILFSRAIVPLHNPTNTAQEFQFLSILTRTYHLFFISDNLVWFWFAFLWWLVMLNIFSYACWSFVYHLWRHVYWSLLPIFKSCYLIFCCCRRFIYWILTSYQIYDLQIFPFHKLTFHSIDCVPWWAQVFKDVPVVYFDLYCQCFWCPIQEIISKFNIMKISSYVFF